MKKIFFYIILGVILIACLGVFIPKGNQNQTQDIPIVDTSTAITVTCHEGLTYAITDTAGNEVTEFKQNTDYTITATGSYGYNVSQIRINDIAQTGTSVTFNTATNEEMTISIIAMPKSIESSDLIVTTNCDYSLTPGPAMYYGNTYTLDANTEDYEGYTISTVVYKGETYSLPYTFILTDLEEKFYLTAIAPYTPEVTATNATYSFTNENEEVVTELVQGTTYTLSADPNQYYNLQETTFNGEVVTLPYTFTAGETAQVVVNTIGMTVIPTLSFVGDYCFIKDSEGNEVTELIYGDSYTLFFNEPYGYSTCGYMNNKVFYGKDLDNSSYPKNLYYDFTCSDKVDIKIIKYNPYSTTMNVTRDDNCYFTYYDTINYNTYSCKMTSLYLKFGTGYKFAPVANPGYKIVTFTLNGEDWLGKENTYYYVRTLETHTMVIETEPITTSNMTITYSGLPTDYKVSTEVVMRVSENEEDGYLKVGSADSSTGTTLNLSEYIGTYPYFVLQFWASDFESDITSQYTIKSAKLNGSSITFTADKEYKLYGYYTLKDFPTTENYTLEITFTAVS